MTPAYDVIDPRQLARVPWANGNGVTRECARSSDGAWRLSVADLDTDAPFSALPGLDRLFVLLTGEVTLTVNGRRRELVAGEVTRFRGEDAVAVSTPGPAQAANVMVTRRLARATYRRERIVRRLSAPRAADELVVLLTAGLRLGGEALPAGTALVAAERSTGGEPHLPLAAPARAVRVCIHRLAESR